MINDPLAVAYYIDRSLCGGFDSYTAVATDGICRGQTVVDSMDFWKKEPNSHVLVKTDAGKFMRFFFARVLKKKDGSRWQEEELILPENLWYGEE